MKSFVNLKLIKIFLSFKQMVLLLNSGILIFHVLMDLLIILNVKNYGQIIVLLIKFQINTKIYIFLLKTF